MIGFIEEEDIVDPFRNGCEPEGEEDVDEGVHRCSVDTNGCCRSERETIIDIEVLVILSGLDHEVAAMFGQDGDSAEGCYDVDGPS